MSAEPRLLEFNRVLQSIAQHLFPLVESKLGETDWDNAVLDVRSPARGGSLLAKFRIHLPDGSTASARIPADVNELLREAWSVKATAFPKKWYGLKLEITPSGECETEFNYDKKCFDDATFVDF